MNGADGLAVDTVFGVIAEEIDVAFHVILLCNHGFHHCNSGQHIVDGPVRIDYLACKTIGINGTAQLVGEGTAVFVYR